MMFNGTFITEDSIESLIYLFMSVWFFIVNGLSNAMIESPKGEYGITIVVMNGHFVRIRIRCCDYLHVLLLDFFKGFMLCDLVGIIGNIDIVFGSVDR